jgi:hypothetical protein
MHLTVRAPARSRFTPGTWFPGSTDALRGSPRRFGDGLSSRSCWAEDLGRSQEGYEIVCAEASSAC